MRYIFKVNGSTLQEVDDPHVRRISTKLFLKNNAPQIRIDVLLSSPCCPKLQYKKVCGGSCCHLLSTCFGWFFKAMLCPLFLFRLPHWSRPPSSQEISIYVKWDVGLVKGAYSFTHLSESVRRAIGDKMDAHRMENGCSMPHLDEESSIGCSDEVELRLLGHALLETFDGPGSKAPAPSDWESALRTELGRRERKRPAAKDNASSTKRRAVRKAVVWEDGVGYETKHNREYAKSVVMDAVVARCGGSRRKVAEILTATVKDFGCTEDMLLTDDRLYKIAQAEEVVQNIKGTVNRLAKRRMTDAAHTALFAVVAACAPVASRP